MTPASIPKLLFHFTTGSHSSNEAIVKIDHGALLNSGTIDSQSLLIGVATI